MKAFSWRMLVSIFVFAISLAYVLPNIPAVKNSFLGEYLPNSQINLGLDLKGGIHLTLGVQVEKAVENALLQNGQDLKSLAAEEGLVLLGIRLKEEQGMKKLVWLLPKSEQETALQELIENYYPDLLISTPQSLPEGGLSYSASLSPVAEESIKNFAQDQALRTLRNRIDQFGVAEPDIRKQADYRIQIQLPGLDDPQRAIDLLGKTAQLTFHLVRDDLPMHSVPPPGVRSFPMEGQTEGYGQNIQESQLLLDTAPLMTGEDIIDARSTFDDSNQASVALSFNSKGATNFARITGEHIQKRLAIVLDGFVHSAPVIQAEIHGGRANITGRFSTQEANDLAIILRAGSLPAPVEILEERTVGPSLGEESINSGLMAALVGALLVMIIMPLYYAWSGFLADIMLIVTLTMLMAGLSAFGATLTLPGIAGIVLTIGMAVDANVLIFERIREELKKGKSPLEAAKIGFQRASISITDSNITTLIVAAILYQIGTGPIRGFAVTLSIGIVASMFTAIFVSRSIFMAWLSKGTKRLSI